MAQLFVSPWAALSSSVPAGSESNPLLPRPQSFLLLFVQGALLFALTVPGHYFHSHYLHLD